VSQENVEIVRQMWARYDDGGVTLQIRLGDQALAVLRDERRELHSAPITVVDPQELADQLAAFLERTEGVRP
jgi:hypothetical protein